MAYTKEIIVELWTAVRTQMERCPGCHGIGQIRQSGDYQSCFCLVCEDLAKALYRADKMGLFPECLPQLHNQTVYDGYKSLFDKIVIAAREFAKRCPGCFGVGSVWVGHSIKACLVCKRLHTALDAYETAVNPTGPRSMPMPVPDNAGGFER